MGDKNKTQTATEGGNINMKELFTSMLLLQQS